MDAKTYAIQNINMQRVISIPLQSTSQINIHVPLNELIAKSQQQQQQQKQHQPDLNANGYPTSTGSSNDRAQVTRMSITSNGSSVISISPPSTPPKLSRSSSRSSPPPTFQKPSFRQVFQTGQQPHSILKNSGVNLTNGHVEAFETDSAMGSSQDDSRSIHSNNSNGEVDIGFNSETSSVGIGADVENNNNSSQYESGNCAVAIFMDKTMAVLIKATCQSESACVDQRFVAVMLSIIKACGLHLKKNEEDDEFNAVTVNKMKLHDSRPAKEHIAELSRELESSITIRDAVFRRIKEKGRCHVGTLVHDVVKADGNCTIARAGCLVEINKSNKYAPAREFADQLCEHIFKAKPRKMGSKQRAMDLQRMKMSMKEGQTVRYKLPKDELLTQTYIFDPTINVAEAARRSFVEIADFFLYE